LPAARATLCGNHFNRVASSTVVLCLSANRTFPKTKNLTYAFLSYQSDAIQRLSCFFRARSHPRYKQFGGRRATGGSNVPIRHFALRLRSPPLHISHHRQEAGAFVRRETDRENLYRLLGLRSGISVRLAADEVDNVIGKARGLKQRMSGNPAPLRKLCARCPRREFQVVAAVTGHFRTAVSSH
jgi:hypothetical protein